MNKDFKRQEKGEIKFKPLYFSLFCLSIHTHSRALLAYRSITPLPERFSSGSIPDIVSRQGAS
uniref:Uncharacterized protein n=1 Tax=Picea glauca TaxID=3330 RepID=A0A101LZ89_PICGL|nr:hypothetical protein ABT39_MTgene4982 [Picea glauca]